VRLRTHQSLTSDLKQVRRSGRVSLVVFSLAAVMVTALACVASFGMLDVAAAFRAGTAMQFTSLCAARS
jgi:Kef-type K+ transport system membrane component KefB